MRVEVIAETGRLHDFAPEWCDFVRTRAGLTPFQTPQWLLTWWSHFGSGVLQVFVFRDPECVAVVPCFIHDWNGARQITLIGSGISDYLDPVITPGFEEKVVAELGRQLHSLAEWHICNWQDLSQESPLAGLARQLRVEVREDTVCSEAELTPDFDAYWRRRPHHVHRNIRRYGERVRLNHQVQFSVLPDARPNVVETLLRLHSARWNAKGKTGMIEANGSGPFLADVARRFAERDMLRIFTVGCDADVVAVLLAFVYEGKIYGYLTGSDPAYHRYSVASLLLSDALRYACSQGFCAWNFCRGDEPYKADWGAVPMPRRRLLIYNSR